MRLLTGEDASRVEGEVPRSDKLLASAEVNVDQIKILGRSCRRGRGFRHGRSGAHCPSSSPLFLSVPHRVHVCIIYSGQMPRLLRHNETNSNDDLPLPSPPPSLSSLSLKVMRLLFLVHPHTHVPVIQTFPYLLCKVMRAILLHVLADEVMLSECAGEGGGNW